MLLYNNFLIKKDFDFLQKTLFSLVNLRPMFIYDIFCNNNLSYYSKTIHICMCMQMISKKFCMFFMFGIKHAMSSKKVKMSRTEPARRAILGVPLCLAMTNPSSLITRCHVQCITTSSEQKSSFKLICNPTLHHSQECPIQEHLKAIFTPIYSSSFL